MELCLAGLQEWKSEMRQKLIESTKSVGAMPRNPQRNRTLASCLRGLVGSDFNPFLELEHSSHSEKAIDVR
jgi:hypothetical protein